MEYYQFVGRTTAPLAFCVIWPMIQLSSILAQGTQITFTACIQCQCPLLCITDEILTLTTKLPKWLPLSDLVQVCPNLPAHTWQENLTHDLKMVNETMTALIAGKILVVPSFSATLQNFVSFLVIWICHHYTFQAIVSFISPCNNLSLLHELLTNANTVIIIIFALNWKARTKMHSQECSLQSNFCRPLKCTLTVGNIC